MPPLLGRFSTTTVWPSGLDIDCATTRATVSVGPPAANGTIMTMLRLGNCWAAAAPAKATASRPSAKALGCMEILRGGGGARIRLRRGGDLALHQGELVQQVLRQAAAHVPVLHGLDVARARHDPEVLREAGELVEPLRMVERHYGVGIAVDEE